jgi:hypothetical protein
MNGNMADKQDLARLEMLEELQYEIRRFQVKVEEAINEIKDKSGHFYYHPKWASLKRACLDMKPELSKITQWNKYYEY